MLTFYRSYRHYGDKAVTCWSGAGNQQRACRENPSKVFQLIYLFFIAVTPQANWTYSRRERKQPDAPQVKGGNPCERLITGSVNWFGWKEEWVHMIKSWQDVLHSWRGVSTPENNIFELLVADFGPSHVLSVRICLLVCLMSCWYSNSLHIWM